MIRPLPRAAQTAEVGRYGVRPQAKLDPDGMQSRQLAVVGDADVSTLNTQVAECRAHFGAERKVLPFRTLRPAHGRPVFSDVARYANLDSYQVACQVAADPAGHAAGCPGRRSRRPARLDAGRPPRCRATARALPRLRRRTGIRRGRRVRRGRTTAHRRSQSDESVDRLRAGESDRVPLRSGGPCSSPIRSVIVEMPSPQPRAMS